MGSIRERISAYLKKNKYCVLCTCSKDALRATPVRYATDDLTVVIYSEQYTKKFKHLRKNKNVAIALHSTRVPIRGLQLWGTAEIIDHLDPRHGIYLFPEAKRSEKLRQACNVLNLILIKPRRIVMLEQSRQRGYRYFVWERYGKGNEKEREVKTIRDLSRM